MGNEQINSCYLSAAKEALKNFPIKAEKIEFFGQSENVTFRIKVAGSDAHYSLRLHRPGYNTIEELRSERMWTSVLSDVGVTVQNGIRSSSGDNYYVLVDIPGIGEQCYAGMTTWVEGVPLSSHLESCESSAERLKQFRRMGELLATMHNQSAEWTPPPQFERRRLDVDALLGEAPFWGRFWEHPELSQNESELLNRIRDELRASLIAYGESEQNFGLIHADLNPENLIYTGEDLAVIDFDDAAYGWHLYDITAALIEFIDDPGIEELRHALLAGYQTYRPLEVKDLNMLPDFQLIRGMAIIGWYYQRPEHAGHDYLNMVKDWVIKQCHLRRS